MSKVFNIGDEFQIEVYSEICCDHCYEIIHNHIDCPVCSKNYAPTEQYHELYGYNEVQCADCGTKFEKISESWYNDCVVRILELSES